MAAVSNAEQTQLQDMEDEDAGMEEREMESDEDEEDGMVEENSDDDDGDSSEDEKENEAEIQRLEEQVISQHASQAWLTSFSRRANENEWMVNTSTHNTSAAFRMPSFKTVLRCDRKQGSTYVDGCFCDIKMSACDTTSLISLS